MDNIARAIVGSAMLLVGTTLCLVGMFSIQYPAVPICLLTGLSIGLLGLGVCCRIVGIKFHSGQTDWTKESASQPSA